MVITDSKNNLCNISFVDDVPEGLSAPPWSPGAQSITTHDIICYGKKKKPHPRPWLHCGDFVIK